MPSDGIIVRCPHCGARNRVPSSRWGDDGAVCGKCKSALRLATLFPDRPVFITDGALEKEVLSFPGPVMLEFFNPG